MRHFLFVLLLSSTIFSCTKETYPYRKPLLPLGHEYSGYWKTDFVEVNGINATQNIKALLWLGIDSTLDNSGRVLEYIFTGHHEETEKNQYNVTTYKEAVGLASFTEIKAAKPWDPSILNFFIYTTYESSSNSGDGSTSYTTEKLILKNLYIKSSTANQLIVESQQQDSIKRVYRFIRQ